MLTEKTIRSLAASQTVYERGLGCYRKGLVTQVTMTSHMTRDGTTILANGTVLGSEDYRTSVLLRVNGGHLEKWSCSCPAARQYTGICKHTVALLIYMSKEGLGADGVTPKKKTTDRDASFLMNRYLEQEKAKASSQLLGEVRLIPMLNFSSYGGAALRLRVGREKLYLVQNLFQLVCAIHNRTTKQYGKAFAWNHDLHSICAADLPLVMFLLNYYDRNAYYSSYNKGSEVLSAGSLDYFWDAVKDRGTLLLEQKKGEKEVTLQDGNPHYTITCLRHEDGGMNVELPQAEVAQGRSHLYCVEGDVLYRTDSAFKDSMEPLLSRTEKRLYVATKEIPLFFSTVYSGISPFVEFAGDEELLNAYLPLQPELICYLDSPADNTVTAKVEFVYGKSRVNPFGKKKTVERRSFGEEMLMLAKLHKYFPQQQEDRLVGEWDEDGFFTFLTDELPSLSQMGEMFISDRLKRISNPIRPKVKAEVSLGNGMLYLGFQISDYPKDELEALLSAYRQRRRFYRLKSGDFVALQEDGLEELAELAETMGLTHKDLEAEKVSLPLYRSLYVDAVLRRRENITYVRNEGFKSLLRTMKNVEDSSVAVPKSLEDTLRNYQKIGFRWLCALAGSGFHGILADDMGLGKTLQILTLLQSHKEQNGSLRAIIVCPASLVLNWKTETEKFCPTLHAVALVGTAALRQDTILSGAGEVLITSYDQLKRDVLHYKGQAFQYAVLDEAQTIKNANTQAAKAVKTLTAQHRFALTGTPVENRLSELWSIFDFLMPGYLFSYKKFKENYEIPGVKRGDQQVLERLRMLAAPFMLRRMKSQVLKELPPKTEAVRFAEMEGTQRKLYAAQLAVARGELENSMESNNKLQILAAMTRLRQICCDPSLFTEGYQGESCKLELCMELVREGTDGGHRILLFSQFTSMLHLLEEQLKQEKISYCLLEGATSKQHRQKMTEDFQAGKIQVFLISLKAGGLGLNLTAADMVILYDPWWNTAAEQQAMDRAYRIGQANRLQVYRLVCKDTIEEGILELQKKKKALGDAVISEGNAMQTMSAADWAVLFQDMS